MGSLTRYQRAQRCDEMDKKYGYERHLEPVERMGWLINMHPVTTLPSIVYLGASFSVFFLSAFSNASCMYINMCSVFVFMCLSMCTAVSDSM